ncbi:unnamed protein product [Rhodiola kirilowii]
MEDANSGSNSRALASDFVNPTSVNVVDDPYYVHHNEITGNLIVSDVLIGQENYMSWRRSMEIAMSGRSKLSFIQGKYPKPNDSVMAARWQRCNDVLMSWLICSVSKKIVLHARDAMMAWETLQSSYAGTNLARISEIQRELGNLVQGDMAVMAFKQKLESLWQELDSIKFVNCANAKACDCCKQHMSDKLGDRVVKFLMGLNDCYASVRTHAFATDEIPKFSVVYGLDLQEEASRAMRKSGKIEASALFSQNRTDNSTQASKNNQSASGYGYNNQQRGKDNVGGNFNRGRSRLFCSHCQMSGHTKETCYRLIGYPQNTRVNQNSTNQSIKGNSGNRHAANSATTDATEESSADVSEKQFTNVQLEQIMAMLKKGGFMDKTESKVHIAVHMAGIAHSHPNLHVGDWLIDSGATSHFAHNEKLLRNLHELKEVHIVIMPNGEVIQVKFSGDCHLENEIKLLDVLLVPMFEVNLILVSKLVTNIRCQVVFTNSGCVIQDQYSRTILQTGKPAGGLYRTQISENGSSVSSIY